MARFHPRYTAIAALFFLVVEAVPVCAADPVELSLSGVEGDARKNVELALTLPHGLVRDKKVDRPWLDRFAAMAPEKVRKALQPFGYYHAEVSAKVTQVREGKYRIEVAVLPGEPVRVGEVEVALTGPGEGEKELRRLLAAFPVRKGEVLVQPDYERAKSALQSKAVSLGYLDADFPRHEIRIASGETSARIHLTMQTGPRYYFDDVTIEGAPDYPPTYLKRFLAFKKGETFSFAKIGETQLNFANSERFRQVVITPEREKAKELQVPVLIRLTSAPRRTVRPGVGFGTDTGGRFSVRYRDLNLFHKGHDLDLSTYYAQRLQGFAGRYTIPSTSDYRSATSFQLNLQQESVTTYDSTLVAMEVNRAIGLGRGEIATPYVKFQQENFTIGDENSSSRLVLPGFRFTKTRFDDLVRPTLGYSFTLDLRGAHQFLGSDSGLMQFIAQGNGLLPLPWRLSIHERVKWGYSLLQDPLGDLPPSIRFFAGGDQSVRGYSYQSLGPRDANGRVIGGKHLLFESLEIERALYKNWGVSLFHDIGNAFNDYANLKLEQGAGIGVHYYTAVGGLNLYVAKPLTSGGNGFRIHFTVGFEL